MATIKRNSGMKRIIIILAFLVCGISSAQQYFFNGTVYVPKTTVQINAIVSPPDGRVEANSDTGSLWYFDGTIWKDTFVGVSSFADLEGDPYNNAMLSDALNSKANDSEVVKVNPNSLVSPLTLAVSDSTTIASGIFTINDVVIDTTTRTPGGDEFVTDGNLSESGVLTLNRNYGSPIQILGFNSGVSDYNDLDNKPLVYNGSQYVLQTHILLEAGAGIESDAPGSEFSLTNSATNIIRAKQAWASSEIYQLVGFSGSVSSGGRINPGVISADFTTGTWKIGANNILTSNIGVSGSFTSADGKTITVTNGLITNISTP